MEDLNRLIIQNACYEICFLCLRREENHPKMIAETAQTELDHGAAPLAAMQPPCFISPGNMDHPQTPAHDHHQTFSAWSS